MRRGVAIIGAQLGLRALWLAHDVGLLRADPRPDEADPTAAATILTTVLRLPPEPAGRLGEQARQLLEVGPDQYGYPSASLHVTLADASNVGPGDALADLEAMVPTLHGCGARVVGFGLSRRTAFAAVLVDAPLRDARSTLRSRWARAGRSGRALPERVIDRMWYANVVRFRSPPSAELIDRLRHLQPDTVPEFRFPTVDLVRTNKVMATERTTSLASFDLS